MEELLDHMKWLLDSVSVKSDVQLLHRSNSLGGLTKVSGIVIASHILRL